MDNRDDLLKKLASQAFSNMDNDVEKFYYELESVRYDSGELYFHKFINDIFIKLEKEYDAAAADNKEEYVFHSSFWETGIPFFLEDIDRADQQKQDISNRFIKPSIIDFIVRNKSKPWISTFIKLFDRELRWGLDLERLELEYDYPDLYKIWKSLGLDL